MATPLITKFEFKHRSARITSEGGEIVRRIYVEPYAAHPTVLRALLGDTFPDGTPDSAGKPARRKPHADPLYLDDYGQPMYYCVEARPEFLNPLAIASSDSAGFEFSGGTPAVEVDRLLNTENKGLSAIENPSAGAMITAVYRPLVFCPGLSSVDDPFDYVDPQYQPITKTVTLGQQLQVYCPKSIIKISSGVNTAATLPETLWEFSIRRIMVPRLPQNTIGLLQNRINSQAFSIGRYNFAPGTLRFDSAEATINRGISGTLWYNINYRFTHRTLIAERCDFNGDWETGPITWNHMLCSPPAIDFPGLAGAKVTTGYYPVVMAGTTILWGQGVVKGTLRGPYLADVDGQAVNLNKTFKDLFRLDAD